MSVSYKKTIVRQQLEILASPLIFQLPVKYNVSMAAAYIDTNIRHKIKKYAETSLRIPIYFVLAGESFVDDDLVQAREALLQDKFPNIHLITLADFIAYIQTLRPLPPAIGIKHIDVE